MLKQRLPEFPSSPVFWPPCPTCQGLVEQHDFVNEYHVPTVQEHGRLTILGGRSAEKHKPEIGDRHPVWRHVDTEILIGHHEPISDLIRRNTTSIDVVWLPFQPFEHVEVI